MSSAVASTSSQRLSDEAASATHSIHSTLSPRIAVLSSPDVQAALDANHLGDFSDLLKPFEDSVENLTVRTSQLETRQCDSFPLSFDSLEAFAPRRAATSNSSLFTPADVVSDQAAVIEESTSSQRSARYSRPELLLDAISARVSAKSKALWDNRSGSSWKRHSRKPSSAGTNEHSFLSTDGEMDLQRYRSSSIDSLTPWFADTKAMVLSTRNMSEHETFGHPLAILLVVSAQSSDPMNAFASLFEASQAHACRVFTHRPYVDPLILRYYVILHDVSKSGSDLTESVALLENVKKTYGLHCCLLPINSKGDSTSQGSEQAASTAIAEQWRRAFRNDRQTGRAGKAEEYPPRVPPKEGQPALDGPGKAGEEQEQEQEAEQEEQAWYSEKDLDGIPFGEALTDDDVRKIKSFVRDFAAQSLIPFLERCVSLWNEQLAASRKGLTGRLFGAASRKFFSSGSGKGSLPGQTAASFATLGYYPHASLEAQTRRLADFAFMTRDYKLATSMYDLGRRDYANDKAAKYIAGANEMFGLSHLMIMLSGHSAPIDVDSYLASAGHHYLISPRQKGSALQLDSLRATLLYYEVYRGLRFYRSAPSALVRTATEGAGDAENDLEVAGAMLLEQAAIADLRQSGRPALRKAALHLIMAAHRYRSCGQKHLSFRCFQGAASLYQIIKRQNSGRAKESQEVAEGGNEGRERLTEFIASHESPQLSHWDYIEDHMEQELGQQASSEGQISQAVIHAFTLLRRQKGSISAIQEESAAKHASYLQAFLTCCKYLDTDLIALLAMHGQEASLPLINSSRSTVRVTKTVQHTDEQWVLLEQEALGHEEWQQSQTRQFAQTVALGETFWVNIELANPLNTAVTITAFSVAFRDENGEEVKSNVATVEVVELVELGPLVQRMVSLAVVATQPCQLTCTSVRYLFEGKVAFQESLLQKGRRLNETKAQRTSVEPQYTPNDSLTVVVENPMPRLEATVKTPVPSLGLGEEVEAVIVLENKGRVGLRRARMTVNRPDAIIDRNTTLEAVSGKEMIVENDLWTSKTIQVPLEEGFIAAGGRVEWPVLLRGSALGVLTLRMLFVYESEEGQVLISQLQHTSQVDAIIDLAVQAGPTRTDDFRYNIRIDSINLSNAEEQESVTLTALSFVSPAWATAADEGRELLDSFADMAPLARQSCSTALEYAPSPSAVKDMDYTVGQLQSLLMGRSTKKDAQPGSTSLHASCLGDVTTASISPFLFLARKEFRLSTLLQQFPSIHPVTETQRIFPLYEPHEVDVIAHWQLSKSGRHGQAFVFGLHLGPLQDHFESLFVRNQDRYTRSLYAEAEKEKAALWTDVTKSRLHMEDDPILFDVVPPSQPHLFVPTGSHGRSLFPVRFLVRNLSTTRSRDIVLQLDNTSPVAVGAATALTAQASYVHRLTFRATLQPQSSTHIQAQASVAKPGDVLLGPVLVKSTTTGSGQGQERSFQRWEHCTVPIKVMAAA